jgi:hypothetical protein
MDDEGPTEIGVVANGSEDRRGGVVWRFLSGSRDFAGGVHVQLEGLAGARCQWGMRNSIEDEGCK